MKPRRMVLPKKELEKIGDFMKSCSKDEYKRALAVVQRTQGIPHRRIASLLGVHVRSVFRWVERYRRMGVEGLRTRHHPGRKRRIGQAEREKIKDVALKSPRLFGYLKNDWSIRLLAKHLTKELGIRVSRPHLHRILREMGLVHKRPKTYVESPDPDYSAKKGRLEGYKRASKALAKKG